MAITQTRPGRAAARAAAGLVLTLATTVMATVTLGALLPAAVASWTSGAPRAVQPVSVRLDGSLSTAGLPDDAAVSRLTLHNDGDGPIRWTVDTDVAAAQAEAVTVEVWVAEAGSCDTRGVTLQPGRWSDSTLEAGGAVPLCVRIADDGTQPSDLVAAPTVSVHARNA